MMLRKFLIVLSIVGLIVFDIYIYKEINTIVNNIFLYLLAYNMFIVSYILIDANNIKFIDLFRNILLAFVTSITIYISLMSNIDNFIINENLNRKIADLEMTIQMMKK